MTNDPKFRSDMTVDLVQHMGTDMSVVWSARVSTVGDQAEVKVVGSDRDIGLINYLMKNSHGTPFEQNSMTFRITAPIMVFREFHRHRIGWSYNELSGRYSKLDPVFYLPDEDRPLVQVGKTGHYEFVRGTPQQYTKTVQAVKSACMTAYDRYDQMLSDGIAREVARSVLPVAIYSTMYATCNARSLMSFLSLRTKHADARNPSFPQYEISLVADQLEQHFSELFPVTHRSFNDNGRVAP